MTNSKIISQVKASLLALSSFPFSQFLTESPKQLQDRIRSLRRLLETEEYLHSALVKAFQGFPKPLLETLFLQVGVPEKFRQPVDSIQILREKGRTVVFLYGKSSKIGWTVIFPPRIRLVELFADLTDRGFLIR